MNRFSPHMEILPPIQRKLWPELAKTPELGLVLYGGTAIALRIGHRASVVFDFFSDRPLSKDELRHSFSLLQKSTVIQDSLNTLTVLAPCGGGAGGGHVKVSFFGGIGFGRVGEPEQTEDGTLFVASLDDLMATKVKVILDRIEAKDYIDIAAMINAGVALARGLAAAREMYGRNFQPSESLKAMVYFEDGDLHTLSSEVKHTLVKTVGSVRALPRIELVSRELARRGA